MLCYSLIRVQTNKTVLCSMISNIALHKQIANQQQSTENWRKILFELITKLSKNVENLIRNMIGCVTRVTHFCCFKFSVQQRDIFSISVVRRLHPCFSLNFGVEVITDIVAFKQLFQFEIRRRNGFTSNIPMNMMFNAD